MSMMYIYSCLEGALSSAVGRRGGDGTLGERPRLAPRKTARERCAYPPKIQAAKAARGIVLDLKARRQCRKEPCRRGFSWSHVKIEGDQ